MSCMAPTSFAHALVAVAAAVRNATLAGVYRAVTAVPGLRIEELRFAG